MREYTIVAASVFVYVSLVVVGRGSCADAPTYDKEKDMSIILMQTKVTEKTIEVRYQIRNDSAHDIWLCDDIDAGHSGVEHYMDKDLETLRVRRRLGVPLTGIDREAPIGRYTRLASQESRIESLLLHLPVRSWPVLTVGAVSRVSSGSLPVKRLCLEIGFYSGNLPETILDRIKDLPELVYGVHPTYPSNVAEWFGGVKSFIRINESLRDRDESVQVPWTNQVFEGEQVLQLAVHDLSVPWVGAIGHQELSRAPRNVAERPRAEGPFPAPSFGRCTRADIQYTPSALEFFFPHASQQDLLSSPEKEYLRTQKTLLVEDHEYLGAFIEEMATGFQCEVVPENATANVVLYRDDECLTSLLVYDNVSIETQDKQRFRYSDGLRSMRQFTPQIRPFDLRLECADHLRNLWYRLRFYHKITDSRSGNSTAAGRTSYPVAGEWSARTELAYRFRHDNHSALESYKCPSAREGKCHYAMNPACEPNSAGDMVLLFETKAGWNQHGGPELFTFDNHDPRGGCVLLNDGTVKFIRTEEELHALRWK